MRAGIQQSPCRFITLRYTRCKDRLRRPLPLILIDHLDQFRNVLLGERKNIIKFGDINRRYMGTVPRIHLVAWLIRTLRQN